MVNHIQRPARRKGAGSIESGLPRGGPQGRLLPFGDGLAWLLLLSTLCVAARPVPVVCAQSSTPTEYEIKAAFLYNFGKFVEWPAGAFANSGDQLIIGVLGEDPYGPVLDEILGGRTVQGKRLVAKRLTKPRDALGCHILFISASEESRLAEILTALEGRSVLTVGDMREFAQRGGMITFTLEEGKVRFQFNLAATERAGLTLRSQLLRLGSIVKRASPRGE